MSMIRTSAFSSSVTFAAPTLWCNFCAKRTTLSTFSFLFSKHIVKQFCLRWEHMIYEKENCDGIFLFVFRRTHIMCSNAVGMQPAIARVGWNSNMKTFFSAGLTNKDKFIQTQWTEMGLTDLMCGTTCKVSPTCSNWRRLVALGWFCREAQILYCLLCRPSVCTLSALLSTLNKLTFTKPQDQHVAGRTRKKEQRNLRDCPTWIWWVQLVSSRHYSPVCSSSRSNQLKSQSGVACASHWSPPEPMNVSHPGQTRGCKPPWNSPKAENNRKWEHSWSRKVSLSCARKCITIGRWGKLHILSRKLVNISLHKHTCVQLCSSNRNWPIDLLSYPWKNHHNW